MTTHIICIDGRNGTLSDSDSVEELRRRVVDAVRSGGGLVRLRSDGGEFFDVLVTEYTPVTIEEVRPVEIDPTAYLGRFVAADEIMSAALLESDLYGPDRLPV